MMRHRMLRQHLRDRFLVATTNGETWDGLLQDWDDDHLVFVYVKALVDGKWVPFDGELWLQRFTIDYMQRVTTPAADGNL